MDARLERERDYHNASFGAERVERKSVAKYYSVSTGLVYYRQLVEHECENKNVLEYGCGPGSSAFTLAGRGAHVTGIDLSNVAIEQARQRARNDQLDGIDFLEGNAEALAFEADSFDLICGSAILHHLDLRKAFSEVSRTLRPDGAAIFVEPLGHNPLINLYRKCTPQLRTVDEHPLLMKDLRLAEEYFGRVETRFFQLQSFLAIPFMRFRFRRRVIRTLDAMDRALFRIVPFARRYAWQVVIVLSQPKKRNAPRSSDSLSDTQVNGCLSNDDFRVMTCGHQKTEDQVGRSGI